MKTLLALATCFSFFHTITADPSSDFAFDLYESIGNDAEGNRLFSPSALFSALGQLALGAEAESWEEIASVLHWTGTQEELHAVLQTQPLVTTALWVQKNFPILPSFTEQIGHVQNIDFSKASGLATVNEWATKTTNGRIQDLLSPSDVNASTRLVLTTALYFHSPWKTPFNPSDTKNLPFHLFSGETLNTPMMHLVASLPFYQNSHLSLVELPYEKEGHSFYLLFPDLSIDIESVDFDLLPEWISHLRTQEISLTMPKFQIANHLVVNDALRSLGMIAPFQPSAANFSNIDGSTDLFLSMVAQGNWMHVDEMGTEAASATAAVLNLKATQKPPYELLVDRPFLFFIMDNQSQSLLFLGHLANPKPLDV